LTIVVLVNSNWLRNLSKGSISVLILVICSAFLPELFLNTLLREYVLKWKDAILAAAVKMLR